MSLFRSQYATILGTLFPLIISFEASGLPTLAREDKIFEPRQVQLYELSKEIIGLKGRVTGTDLYLRRVELREFVLCMRSCS